MADPVSRLLQRVSWQAEKLFKQRGHFRSMLWLTECSDGRRERSETDCGVSPEDASDLEVLSALVAEMRADFARDGVVRFAVAYPARAHGILNPLHNKPQTRAVDVVTIEAHDVDANYVAYRQVHRPPGRVPTLGPLTTPEPVRGSRYTALLAA